MIFQKRDSGDNIIRDTIITETPTPLTGLSDSKLYNEEAGDRTSSASLSDKHQIDKVKIIPFELNNDENNPENPNSKKLFKESDAGDGTKREDQYLHGLKLYVCIFSNCSCLFLVAVDQTITMTILTLVANHFNSFDNVTWVTSAFVLCTGALVQVWGKLSITFGRKRCMLIGLFLFELGSLICALADSMNTLIIGRALQGVGGSGIQTCVFVISAEIVTIDKKPILFGLNGVVFAVASVIGPILGGLLTSARGWRWCFWINLCFGGLVVPLFCYSFNPPAADKIGGWPTCKEKLKTIDYLGTILVVGGIVLLLLGISLGGSRYQWDSAAIICMFIFGGLLFSGFMIWNFKYSKNPILPFEIIRIPQMDAAFGFIFFMNGAFIASLQFLAIYFQIIHNEDPFHSGVSLLPNVIPTVICSAGSGLLIHLSRHVKLFTVLSGIYMPLGIGLFVLLGLNPTSSAKIGLLIIGGIGMGLSFQSPMISAQLIAPKTPGSTILTTTFVNFGRQMGAAVASELAQLVYTATLKKYLNGVKGELTGDYGFDILLLSKKTDLVSQLNQVDLILVKHCFLKSINNVFYFCVGLSGIGFTSGLLTSNKRIPKKEDIAR